MLPTLSCLSVSTRPVGRLRHRCSSRYLRISPLHREFHQPLRYSSHTVSGALPGLSPGISHPTFVAAYTRFTPSNSEQRLHPLSYRGCWHRVSRCLLKRYRHHRGCWPRLIRPPPQSFTTRRPSSLTRHHSVRLAPIAEYSSLQPPVGVWAVLSPSVGGQSLNPPRRLSLGEPLPHQLANPTRADLLAINLSPFGLIRY